jgi:hypothetical protein
VKYATILFFLVKLSTAEPIIGSTLTNVVAVIAIPCVANALTRLLNIFILVSEALILLHPTLSLKKKDAKLAINGNITVIIFESFEFFIKNAINKNTQYKIGLNIIKSSYGFIAFPSSTLPNAIIIAGTTEKIGNINNNNHGLSNDPFIEKTRIINCNGGNIVIKKALPNDNLYVIIYSENKIII